MGIVGCHWTLKKHLTNYCACGGLTRGPPALGSFKKGTVQLIPWDSVGKKAVIPCFPVDLHIG